MANTAATSTDRYIRPEALDVRVFNPIVARLARMGISIRGSRVLEVRGRTSGEWRGVPVNPLPLGDDRFLVAPRGTTQWVRNLRAAGGGRLRKGRWIEHFTVVEVADADKTPVLRAYLDEWSFEVGKFFDGVTKDSTEHELAMIAPGFPVFRIDPTPLSANTANASRLATHSEVVRCGRPTQWRASRERSVPAM